MRYLLPNGTAGFAMYFVSTPRRAPCPPARIIATTSAFAIFTSSIYSIISRILFDPGPLNDYCLRLSPGHHIDQWFLPDYDFYTLLISYPVQNPYQSAFLYTYRLMAADIPRDNSFYLSTALSGQQIPPLLRHRSDIRCLHTSCHQYSGKYGISPVRQQVY